MLTRTQYQRFDVVNKTLLGNAGMLVIKRTGAFGFPRVNKHIPATIIINY